MNNILQFYLLFVRLFVCLFTPAQSEYHPLSANVRSMCRICKRQKNIIFLELLNQVGNFGSFGACFVCFCFLVFNLFCACMTYMYVT